MTAVKFCTACGTMHLESGDLCKWCSKKQEKQEQCQRAALRKNKNKRARFDERGNQVGC